jgi:hypothetical protein
MSRFLGSRLTIVGLLVSILVVAIGVSAVMGAGSGANSGASDGASPAIQASPLYSIVEECSGTASFDVYGAGWDANDVVLITLATDSGRLFVGAGFPGASGAFHDSVSAPISSCGVASLHAKGASGESVAPASVIGEKPE